MKRPESAFTSEIQQKTNDIEKRLTAIKDSLRLEPDNEFLIKTQSLLNDWVQILKEQQKTQDDLASHLNERIVQLTGYLKDPNFKNYEREQKGAGITSRPFEYLQNLNQGIIELKKSVESLIGQEKDVSVEYENKKRYLAGVKETYKKKREELVGAHIGQSSGEPFGLSTRQKGELLILEEKFYHDKTVLEEMHLKDIENKRAAISMNIMMTNAKLDILKNILAKEKSSTKVTELDIFVARDDLAKHKQHVDAEIASMQKEIDQFDTKASVLQEMSKRYDIPLTTDLDEWKTEPTRTVDSYSALFEVGLVNDQSLLARREKDLLETRKLLEQEQFALEALQVDIQESYYRAAVRKFKAESDIDAELKKYISLRDDVIAKSSDCTSRRKSFVTMSEAQRHALESLHNRERDLKKIKETVFRNNQASYVRVLDLILSAQTLVKRQIKIIEEIVSIYDEILSKINAKSLQLNFIIDELENIKWYRSKYAITLKDVGNIGADMSRFVRDVKTYVTHFNLRAFAITMYLVLKRRFPGCSLF